MYIVNIKKYVCSVSNFVCSVWVLGTMSAACLAFLPCFHSPSIPASFSFFLLFNSLLFYKMAVYVLRINVTLRHVRIYHYCRGQAKSIAILSVSVTLFNPHASVYAVLYCYIRPVCVAHFSISSNERSDFR